MEKNDSLAKIIRRFFVVVELILLVITGILLTMLYSRTAGAGALLVFAMMCLACWYQLKTMMGDSQLGFKPRVIYFACCVSCVALLFAFMHWPSYRPFLVVALACLAAGWGVFLWSRQRSKDTEHKAAANASTYMMFMRLAIYTGGCLFILLSEKIV